MVTLAACSRADFRLADEAPDPEVEVIVSRDCPAAPYALCDAMAPSAGGCTGEPERDAASALLPTDASFPPGCVVNVPSTYRTPQGECLVAYACRCTSPGPSDGGSQWSCVR